jgi:hypothetical protein
MNINLKSYVRKLAKTEFGIPKSKYISVFKVASDTFLVTYELDSLEHKHVITV